MEREKSIILLADVEFKNKVEISTMPNENYDVIRISDFNESKVFIENKVNLIAIIVTNSIELLKWIKLEIGESIARVILITENTIKNKTEGLQYGAIGIITRPFNEYMIKKRLEVAIKSFEHTNKLEELVSERTEQIKKDMEDIKNINMEIVETLSSIVEFRNMESGGHIRRIRRYTGEILKCLMVMYPEYKITAEKASIIEITSAMHDIGKIAVPDRILLKKGPLNEEERELMKKHTTLGAEIVDKIAFKGNRKFHKYCYEIAKYHHERYDGKGYPIGLKGEDIPIAAQIVAIADVYDALVSERIYKESFSCEKAFQMILNNECGVFSDKIISCFIAAKENMFKISREIQ